MSGQSVGTAAVLHLCGFGRPAILLYGRVNGRPSYLRLCSLSRGDGAAVASDGLVAGPNLDMILQLEGVING